MCVSFLSLSVRFTWAKNEVFVFFQAFIRGDVAFSYFYVVVVVVFCLFSIYFNVSIRFDAVVSGFACNEW